jgi:Cellulase (glycosyl hydrolase family 5)
VPNTSKYNIAVEGKSVQSVPPTVHGLQVSSGDAVVITAIPIPTPPPTPPTLLKKGFALGYEINNRSSANQDAEIAQAVGVGCQTARVDGANSAVISKLNAAGIKPVIILGSNPTYPWATTASQYATSCATTAAQYVGQVLAWEIMNEPDLHGWTPATYGPYLSAAYSAIKIVDPNAKVITGGNWKWQYDPNNSTSLTVVDWYDQLGAGGYLSKMDAANVHCYDGTATGDWSMFSMCFGTPGTRYATKNVRSVLASHGFPSMPLWNTESGGPTPKYTAAQQASLVTQTFAATDGVGIANGKFTTSFIYCLLPDDGTETPGFALTPEALAAFKSS